jgi:hypothetical protein
MESYKAMAGSKGRPFTLQHCYTIPVTMDAMTREPWNMRREDISRGGGKHVFMLWRVMVVLAEVIPQAVVPMEVSTATVTLFDLHVNDVVVFFVCQI